MRWPYSWTRLANAKTAGCFNPPPEALTILSWRPAGVFLAAAGQNLRYSLYPPAPTRGSSSQPRARKAQNPVAPDDRGTSRRMTQQPAGGGQIKHRDKLVVLLEKDGQRLYRLLVRLTLREDVAEDLLQDLAIKLASADGFAEARNPYAYARTAAVRLAFDWRRRQRAQLPLQSDPDAQVRPSWVHLVRQEEIECLMRHMDQLAERDRLILILRFFDGAPFRQISRVVGGTTQQVRGLCYKALRRLRDRMAGIFVDGPVDHEEAGR